MTLMQYLETAAARRGESVHESLVCLFSDATYGSDWIEMFVPKGDRNHELVQEWKAADKTKFGDCCEDKWAYVLLHGGTIAVLDHYAIGDGDSKAEATHTLCMEDFDKAMDAFALTGAYTDFLDENDDMYTGDTFVQCAVFGEPTYG